MIQRRAEVAGIKTRIGNHTFRATGFTAYLKNKGTLETAQHIANRESPRTTKLYDRRQDEISLDEVRIFRSEVWMQQSNRKSYPTIIPRRPIRSSFRDQIQACRGLSWPHEYMAVCEEIYTRVLLHTPYSELE